MSKDLDRFNIDECLVEEWVTHGLEYTGKNPGEIAGFREWFPIEEVEIHILISSDSLSENLLTKHWTNFMVILEDFVSRFSMTRNKDEKPISEV